MVLGERLSFFTWGDVGVGTIVRKSRSIRKLSTHSRGPPKKKNLPPLNPPTAHRKKKTPLQNKNQKKKKKKKAHMLGNSFLVVCESGNYWGNSPEIKLQEGVSPLFWRETYWREES